MTYADLTFAERNPVKRRLQNRRLLVAAGAMPASASTIVDYGAGNGELVKVLASRRPGANYWCFEPTPTYLAQAKDNLRGVANVRISASLANIPQGSADAVFCLEVFEHLPEKETADAIAAIRRLLTRNGRAIIGVPVEVGIPALYKGAFRMLRRFGSYDARPGNVLRSALGRPPQDRPVKEIAPGFHYHSHHTGFDHRRLRRQLAEAFTIEREVFSPSPIGGATINPEINFVVKTGRSN